MMKAKKTFQIIQFDMHSTADVPPSAILKKIQIFLGKNYFSRKNQILNVLRNLTILDALWQISYNLLKKIHLQKRERTSLTQLANIA